MWLPELAKCGRRGAQERYESYPHHPPPLSVPVHQFSCPSEDLAITWLDSGKVFTRNWQDGIIAMDRRPVFLSRHLLPEYPSCLGEATGTFRSVGVNVGVRFW